MVIDRKKLTAKFFHMTSGKEPVRQWLLGLDKEDRKLIGIAIKDCEFSWPIGLPLCRQIKGHKGLWEVRCDITNKRIVRVMFCVDDGEMILLHGFIKKSQKTELKEINLAVKRQKEYEANG
ncbi:MAG: type II toxin-antitoxin system RelE/ParE family toxin [Rickettsiales bacterium]|nr:type II toxin-antitoxin system RelE/ParE family toxin [Rickettsiales bacterium]